MLPARDSLAILIPCFNDWEPARMLLAGLDRAVAGLNWQVSVLIVDDASSEPLPEGWPGASFDALSSIEVLHLRSNLGHQRAIALGLYHIHEFTSAAAVIVMDGDGEDRAEDLPALLQEFERSGRRDVVFASRMRRTESLTFKFFYGLYRLTHRVLTGVPVRAGNFSVMPRAALTRLMGVPDVWNHYAAAVHRARLRRRMLPLARGRRLAGSSHMNFVSLLIHGLTAMSVFSDQASARLLAASAGFGVFALAMIGVTTGVRLFTGLAVPGWATSTIGLLLVLVVQSLSFTVLFAFLIAARRSSVTFILARDAPYFILGKTTRAGTSQLAQLGRALAEASPPNVPVDARVGS